MKTTTTNPPGQWTTWPPEIFYELQNPNITTEVGEKLAYQDSKIKVWTIHLEPGKRLPFHKHQNPYLYTILTEGTSRSYHHDGSIHDTIYQIGDTKNLTEPTPQNPFIHNLENTGQTTLIFTTIEFLKQ